MLGGANIGSLMRAVLPFGFDVMRGGVLVISRAVLGDDIVLRGHSPGTTLSLEDAAFRRRCRVRCCIERRLTKERNDSYPGRLDCTDSTNPFSVADRRWSGTWESVIEPDGGSEGI